MRKYNQKLGMLLIMLAAGCQLAYAEEITYESSYPTPFARYDKIQLMPIPYDGGFCQSGELFIRSSDNELVFCENGRPVQFNDIWQQYENQVFLGVSKDIGIGTTKPEHALTVTEKENSDKIMFFDSDFGAFRSGGYTDSWNDGKLGQASAAFGSSTEASGDYTMALGEETTAAGNDSLALGYGVRVGDYYSGMADGSIALGNSVLVSYVYSIGIGLDDVKREISQTQIVAIVGGDFGVGSKIANSLNKGRMVQVYSPSSSAVVLKNNNNRFYGFWANDGAVEAAGQAFGSGFHMGSFGASPASKGGNLHISSSGNVGIGTDNPQATLHIAAPSDLDDASVMVEGLKGDSDQSYLCVDAEGILFRSDAPCVLPDDGGVDTQVCPDGRIIPADMICEPDTQVCPDGSVIPADSNCPVVNGGWCAWGAWSACSGGVQTAARSCDCPAPSSGGANCVGSSTMTQNCGGGGGGGCGSKCVEEQQVACTAEEVRIDGVCVLIDNNGNEDLDPSKMVCTEDCTILQLDGTYACEMFCESNYIERVTAGGTSLEDFPGNNYFGDLGCYKVNPKNDNALLLCPDLENHIFINGNSEDVLAFYRSIMESTNAANEIMVAQCTDLGDGNVNCIINPDEAIGMYDGQTDNSGKSYFLRERTREDGDARVIDVCQAIDSNTIACFMVENVDVMGVQGQMSMDFGDNQAQLIETYCQQNCGDSQQYGLVDQDCLLQCSMSYANIQYDPAL